MMRADMLAVYPQLGDIAIEYAWPGIMGYAPAHDAAGREIEPGLWVCSAFGGHGLARRAGADAVAAASPARTTAAAIRAVRRPLGRRSVGPPRTQLVYWQLQASDWWDEKRQVQERGDAED